MKTEQEIIPAPIGGLNLSASADEILPLEMSDCQNVSVRDSLIVKRYGYETFGDNLPLSGAVMGIDVFKTMAGTDTLLAMTTRDIYKWNTSTSEWDLLTVHASIDDCDDDATAWTPSANVTAAFEDTILKEGDGSVKLTLAADFTTGLAAYHDKAIGNITAYNHLRVWIRSSVALAAGDFQIVVDDTAACASALRSLDLPAVAADTWTHAFLDLRSSGSVADLTAIASIGLKAITDVGACVIYLDQFDVYDCFTGDDDDYFSFDHIRKATESDLWWCCANYVNATKMYDGDTFGDLTGSPPKAKILRQLKDYLFELDTVEGGKPMQQRVRWPDTADPTEWNTGNSSYQDLPGSDWIKGAVRYRNDYLVVLKSRSLWLGYSSADTAIFQFDNNDPKVGCAAGRTAVFIDGLVVFLGWSDIYKFDGIEAESIGSLIRKEVFRAIKTEEIDRSFGIDLEEYMEYWLHVTTSASSYPDIAWVLNRQTGRFTRYKFADHFTAHGLYQLVSALKISDLTMKIGDMTWKLDDRRILKQYPTLLLGDKDGYIYEYSSLMNDDNGTAIDAWFDTKDFNPAGPDSRIRAVRLDVYYEGASLDVYYSTDRGLTWTLLDTLDTSTNMDEPITKRFRVTGPRIRWRFRNGNAGETFSFQRAVMYWQKAGKRLNV